MKMWICRDNEGLVAFHNMPIKIYGNPNDETDYWWAASDWNEPIILHPSEYPEVTFENSPMEVELVIKKSL